MKEAEPFVKGAVGMRHPGRVEDGVLLPGELSLCCDDDAQDLWPEVSAT